MASLSTFVLAERRRDTTKIFSRQTTMSATAGQTGRPVNLFKIDGSWVASDAPPEASCIAHGVEQGVPVFKCGSDVFPKGTVTCWTHILHMVDDNLDV